MQPCTDYRNKIPKSSFRGIAPQNADGLFTQSEQFDLQTFMERANWSRVAALLLPLSVIVIGMLAVSLASAR